MMAAPNPIMRNGSSGSVANHSPPPQIPPASHSPVPFFSPSVDPLARYSCVEYYFNKVSAEETIAAPASLVLLDVDRQIFGLNLCRHLLDGHVGAPYETPNYYSGHLLRPNQIMYLFGPDGSGFRTLVTNYCRERRINVIIVTGGPPATAYDVGTYAALLDRAVAMQPCVVFIDRLDTHWSQQFYDRTGVELFSEWKRRGFQHCRPLTNVWFVISGTVPIDQLHQSFHQEVQSAWAVTEALENDQITLTMAQVYAQCLREVGFQDDRPSPPRRNEPSIQVLRQIAERMEQSRFQALLVSQKPLLEAIALRIGNGAQQSKRFVIPRMMAEVVRQAFFRAIHRLQQRPPHDRVIDERVLPTQEDFVASVRACINFPCPE